jgi:hypothetical protein
MAKGGISSSIGFRGFHINISRRGIRQSIGLPGTGLSETSYIGKHETDSKRDKDADARPHEPSERARIADQHESPREEDEGEGCSCWVVLIVFLIVLGLLYWAGTTLGWIPPHFLSNLLSSVTEWVRKAGR